MTIKTDLKLKIYFFYRIKRYVMKKISKLNFMHTRHVVNVRFPRFELHFCTDNAILYFFFQNIEQNFNVYIFFM